MLLIIASFAAAAQAPAAQPVAPDQEVICKREKISEVGTHMRSKKVCRTKADWDYIEKDTQYELNKLNDRASFDPGRAEAPR